MSKTALCARSPISSSKLRRFVPGFAPKLTFHRAVLRMVQWRNANADKTKPDAATDAILDRLVEGYHRAAEVYASLAPKTQ